MKTLQRVSLSHLQGRAVAVNDSVQDVVFSCLELFDNGDFIQWGDADAECYIGEIWHDNIIEHEQLEGLDGIEEDIITLRNGSQVKFSLLD